MVKKMQSTGSTTDRKADARLAGTVKESAGQIWLAGLGAFAKAQEEGSKVFDALVREGTAMQRKTQAAAEEKISEATNRMASMATDISSRASGQWDKLESIFEERVSRAMAKLGVPASRDLQSLVERIEALERKVGGAGAKASKTTRPRAAAKAAGKTPAKKRVSRKST